MRCLQGIFFDLDDTLINSSVAMHAALTETLPLVPHLTVATLGAALTDTYQELWGYGTPGYPSLRQLPTMTLRRRLTEGALHRLEIQDATVTEALLECYTEAEREVLQPLPGVPETLEMLKPHFRLGVITNGPSHLQREKLTQVGLAHFFDTVVADSDLGFPKPDPRLFAHAAQQIGLSALELLFAGDSPQADVAGANAAGWISVYIGSDHCAEASFTVSRIEELVQLQPLLETKRLAFRHQVADTRG